MPHSGRLESMFRSANALYSVAAHNRHRTNSRRQFGGTFAMAFGKLAKATDSNVDPTGLGKWSWHHKKNFKDTGLYTIVTPSTSPHPTPLERRYEGSSL
jgi:hypothetical protein